MDVFGVPKKINRHVLKAIYAICEDGYASPHFDDICEIVKETMRNNVPVRNLRIVVAKSLQNLADIGIIGRDGSNFFLRNADASLSGSSSAHSEMNEEIESDVSAESGASGSKRSTYYYFYNTNYPISPHKRRRLSEGSLDREEIDNDNILVQRDTTSEEHQGAEESSNFPQNMISGKDNFQRSETNSVTSKIDNFIKDNGNSIVSEENNSLQPTTNREVVTAPPIKDTILPVPSVEGGLQEEVKKSPSKDEDHNKEI